MQLGKLGKGSLEAWACICLVHDFLWNSQESKLKLSLRLMPRTESEACQAGTKTSALVGLDGFSHHSRIISAFSTRKAKQNHRTWQTNAKRSSNKKSLMSTGPVFANLAKRWEHSFKAMIQTGSFLCFELRNVGQNSREATRDSASGPSMYLIDSISTMTKSDATRSYQAAWTPLSKHPWHRFGTHNKYTSIQYTRTCLASF